MEAVVMTGGKGSRMAPYTQVLPKGLLPVGGQPMLDTIVRQLKGYGCSRITMTCGYLGELIQTYFGDGHRYGIEIHYLNEKQPLGTVGALKNAENLPQQFLVMNCDILTALNFRGFAKFHNEGSSLLTIASQRKKFPLKLGVLTVANDRVTGFAEKPQQSALVSMGMYMMNRKVLEFIPPNQFFDIPDLVRALLQRDLHIRHFENEAFWLDVGTPDDYAKACDEFDVIRPHLFQRDIE